MRTVAKVSRRAQVAPFAVMSILNRVAELRAAGRDVLSLCAGEPSQGAPSDVRRRAAELMSDRTPLGYTETFGIRPLREQLAGHYLRWYDLEIDPRNIALTTGSSGAFLLSFLAAFDPGDRVALTRPGYPAYRNILISLGCEVVDLPCGPAEDYRPSLAMLDAAGPLAGVVIASPANPTGTMIGADLLGAIAGWCAERGVRLVSDEIYHGIGSVQRLAPLASDPAEGHRLRRSSTQGRDRPAPPQLGGAGSGHCAWEYDRSPVVISSFSKYWGMTGWRLGWALVPDDLVAAFDALAGNYALCPPVPAQHAAVAAFTDTAYAEAQAAVEEFADARRLVMAAIPELGWTGVAPADGAFYVYADIGDVLGPYADSAAWCSALLETEGVALTPGLDFDPVDGGRTVRLSLAAGPETVAAALGRIRRFTTSAATSPCH